MMGKKLAEKWWHLIRHVKILEDKGCLPRLPLRKVVRVHFFPCSFILLCHKVQVQNYVKEDIEWLVPKQLSNWIVRPVFPPFFLSCFPILYFNPLTGPFHSFPFDLDCCFFNCISYLPSFIMLFLQLCSLFCFHLQSVPPPLPYFLAVSS